MKIKPLHVASAVAVFAIALALIMGFNNHRFGRDVGLMGEMGPYGDGGYARYVSVTGDGTVKVTPDSVRVEAAVSSLAPTAAGSLALTAKSADKFRSSLKSSGVEAKYIQAVNLSTNPEYSYSNNSPAKITGYRSTQNFTIVIRDAKNSGLIIQSAQSAVGDTLSISATSPFVFDQKIAESNARTLAVAAAKAKAESFASLTGSKLGSVLSIEEQVSQPSPVPVMAMAKSAGVAGAPVQVDLGEQSITITVTIKWALR